jgi:photosystem II PsbU protein
MSRHLRRFASVFISVVLLAGFWFGHAPTAGAAELRNLADDKIAQAEGKVDLNNASVRRFQQYPGMYPTLAGKIVVGGPYESVDDVLKLDLTERQKELFEKYRDNFTVTKPEIALNEGFDRINDGQYR